MVRFMLVAVFCPNLPIEMNGTIAQLVSLQLMEKIIGDQIIQSEDLEALVKESQHWFTQGRFSLFFTKICSIN